jgi:hypothetical protein
VAGIEATGTGFRARAGTLTLLYMTSVMSPEALLEMLERALHGGLLRPIESDVSREEMRERYEAELEKYWGDEEEPGGEDELREDDDEDGLLADYDGDVEEEDDGAEAIFDAAAVAEPEPFYRASAKGVQALYVASLLQRWLRNCPDGPLEIGPDSGEAMASLVCCWSATVIHALAREPLTLTELDRAVAPIEDRDVVEEHVDAMTRVGHLEILTSGGETRYALTDWLREGIAPLAAAARMEVHYPEEGIAPPDILDIEAAFQLALPLLSLPSDLQGSCTLGVRLPAEQQPLTVGATARVADGRVVSSSPLLEEDPQTWAIGSPRDWLDTLVDPSAARIEVGGDIHVANALIASLHEKLFAPPGLVL